ncbi:hypothetical protein A2W24_02035 [Microgenomates group bacterium RBG_16_45_19]|nr:MAG: hypothetical protein A2W24_02035 [Microgenomates group bacterium RBG_16_45_19]
MSLKKRAIIDEKTVAYVRQLAALNLTPDQIKQFAPQLSTVLSYVAQIQELDTKQVPETHQVTYQTNVFRPDVIDTSRCLSQAQALENAPQTHHGYFVVKSIF